MMQQGTISLAAQALGSDKVVKPKEPPKIEEFEADNFQFDHKITAMDRFLEFQANVIERGME